MFLGLLVVLSLWSLVWKGLALYKSARRREVAWFVVMLVLNTAGILPIIYLLIKLDKPSAPGQRVRNTSVRKSSKQRAAKTQRKKPKRKTAKKKTTRKRR